VISETNSESQFSIRLIKSNEILNSADAFRIRFGSQISDSSASTWKKPNQLMRDPDESAPNRASDFESVDSKI